MLMQDDFQKAGGQRLPAKLVTGRQACRLTVPGTASAEGLSVETFRARVAICEPYLVRVTLTHPDALDRADYVGRDATFTIDYGDGLAPRNFCGYILHFSKLKTTDDFSSYKITVVPHIRRLDDGPSTRIFQRKSTPEIIEAMMRARGFLGHQFDFRLRREYPQHDFRFQYGQSDLQYIRMLMEKAGIYSYIIEGEFGDVVVFADDIDHYIYEPELKVLYREMSGMTSDELAVSELKTHVSVVPQSFLVADYNPDKAWERYRAESNISEKDTMTSGQPYIYGTHHLDQEGARWEAQLRHEAAIAWQVVYEGKSNILELTPGRILRMDEVLPDAPNGQVIIEVTHSGGRQRSYYNRYKAIPSERRLRLQLRENTWPKIAGTLTARITSPGKYKYAYMTSEGRYSARFDCDFATWNPGGESVPLRLAKPFAGALQTGFHFPLIDGTEVGIAFIDGNPDKPYIAHAHHHSQATDLITNQDRWLSRNVIRTQSNNKVRMEDWEGEEHIKISTEHSGKSQLTLGHMVNNKRQKRGAGFELRTSAHGAIRSGKGLYISAYDQPKASGQQLEMQQAEAVLESALTQMKVLAEMVRTAQAQLADIKAQETLKDATFKELRASAVLIAAPAGIALATPESVQHSAGKNVTLTAGGSIDAGAIENVTIAAGQVVSLFANEGGMKLIAAQGNNEIQAQHGNIECTAAENIRVSASNGNVEVSAKDSLTLRCGGAEIKLQGGNIELSCPGDVKLNCITLQKVGPGSVAGLSASFDLLSCMSALKRVASTGGAFA
jgi:type VI secretion system secreted protein VgrG